MENYSEGLATGMALSQNPAYGYGNGFGFGGNGSWGELIGLIVVAGLFGFGNFGGGYGGRGNCATQADVRAAVDQQTLISKIDQQTYGLADTFNALNNTLNSNFRNIDNAICTLGYQNAQLISGLSRELADCCCTTQRAIDGVNYNMAKNTCDIIRANQDNTRAILDFLNNEKIEALRAENVALKGQISNDRQSAYIIGALAPKCPEPAYIVPNPNCCYNYNVNGFGYNSCGCN